MNWGNDQYQMAPNMMGMPPMMQNMMHPPLLPPPMMQNMLDMPNNVAPMPQIGPVMPESMQQVSQPEVQDPSVESTEVQMIEDDTPAPGTSRQGAEGARSRDSRNTNRDRDRDNRQQRRRTGSRERRDRNDRVGTNRVGGDRVDHNRADRNDRNDRSRHDRRDRKSKWDNNDKAGPSDKLPGTMGMTNMMMPGMAGPMMSYGMMGQQPGQMDMANMSNMGNMGNMGNMSGMMPGVMNPMMEQNMYMMNQPMMPMMNQAIFSTNAVLLPPIPGASMPNRRERPPGCRTIFVGGLPSDIKEDVLTEIFQRFGNVVDIKLHRQGVCHIRFEKQEHVEQSFFLSGYRFKYHNQSDTEAVALFIDYALAARTIQDVTHTEHLFTLIKADNSIPHQVAKLFTVKLQSSSNRDDYAEFERSKRNKREPTPPRIEPCTPATMSTVTEKVKSDDQFAEAAPTLVGWLERGECNKKNANTFYSLIQASNNQIRRLFNEKMVLDDEYHNMKVSMKEKFAHILLQFEQVAKILSAARHQRVSDHFNKQQRRNIEMWLKMTEEVENIKEEFETNFNDDEIEKIGKNTVPQEKYDELKQENENLMYELEGYKNEAHLAKDEAERKFETFKAHFIAQHNLNNKNQTYPPLPPPPIPHVTELSKPMPPPPTPDDNKVITTGPAVPPSEAKLISILTAFLMVHPLGASLDYLVSYVRSMTPNVTQATVQDCLQKYNDVFRRVTSGVGASIEHRWCFVTFDLIKAEA